METALRHNIYTGGCLPRALECLRAGYPNNAASWIERELGESCSDIYWGSVDPNSIVEDQHGFIWFDTFAESMCGLDGDGI